MLQLNFNDSLVVCGGSGLLAHLIYNKFEPYQPIIHALLLGAAPWALGNYLLKVHESTPLAMFHAYGLYLGTLLVSLCIYRLNPFHPIAKYPGPMLLKLSKFPMAIESYRGKKYMFLYNLHQEYGPVVRVGPNHLSFSDPAVLLDMMGSKGLQKGSFWHGFISDASHISLTAIPPSKHKARRLRWSRGFNAESLKHYEETIAERSRQIVDAFDQRKNQPIDMSDWTDWFAFDIMCDMAYGGGSDMIRHGDKDGVWKTVLGARPSNSFFGQIPWSGKFNNLLMKVMKHPLVKFREFVRVRVDHRIESGGTRRDLFFFLSDEPGLEPRKPTHEEMLADGAIAIVAGSDTTSTCLSNIYYFLIKHPEVYKRLQKEIDETFPDNENTANASKHAHMKYLNAVINETLRLYPIVPSGSPRQMTPGGGGGFLGPYFVPDSTEVQLHTYTMQRDPANFSPAPDVFIADRWLAEEDRDPSCPPITEHNMMAYTPFSFGPSNCAGKNLALMEMRMMLSMVLQKFDLEKAPDYDLRRYEESIQDYFGTHRGPLMIKMTPRNRVASS